MKMIAYGLVSMLVMGVSIVSRAGIVKELTYDGSIGKFGAGDVYLPEKLAESTPAVLIIHGGGWGGMDRSGMVGAAKFFCDRLGFVVYNVDYRLAGKDNPWPACGDDCVKAGEFMFSNAFAEVTGIRPKRIWICGGSAGGHLTLWTALSLPASKVAGAISISGIAEPAPDAAVNYGRYVNLFGQVKPTEKLYDSMNPMKLIKPNGPRLLLTHATEDKVVPIASAKLFADAYRSAGNTLEFFEYPCDIEPGLTGHCIWRPNTKPRRLIGVIEGQIARFVGHELGIEAVKKADK